MTNRKDLFLLQQGRTRNICSIFSTFLFPGGGGEWNQWRLIYGVIPNKGTGYDSPQRKPASRIYTAL